MKKIPLVVLMGPTASGKTAMAVEICKKYDGEVVTADSMQVYKFMDIGTAKPTVDEMQGIKHHMIDLVEPTENYSLADYVKEAKAVIEDIHSRGKLPVLAGGTGLYIDTLTQNVELSDGDKDDALRAELTELAEKEGEDRLFEILREIDPMSCETIHKNNIKRVIRAIEFFKTTGIRQSEHIKNTVRNSPFDMTKICLSWDRDVLYDRINRRVDMMFDMGLADEVEKVRNMGVNMSNTSMQGIGYKEVFPYLDKKVSLEETKDIIKQGTRRYAKRQITWFKREENTSFVPAEFNVINKILKENCYE
ncbi:MAG: tRNA (adenosine(37)-N6)-dimethylallyltransferase MiaA [Clostridia bacterium]|nr:tRNA (adenosine(37)-N6)-dimethylallyltransferase MiaA [Clostridia bacterium]